MLGYDATAAGAALLPTILLITLLSPAGRRAGHADRTAAADDRRAADRRGRHAVLAAVDGSRPYVVEILPGSLLQGLGMAIVVAPLTATVLGAAPDALAGIASGVNNAVARAAQLLAVAALPVAVGLSGDDYADPVAFTSGFRTAMIICAVLFAAGGVISLA